MAQPRAESQRGRNASGATEALSSLSSILEGIEAASWSPQAFASRLPEIVALRYQLPPSERTRWLVGMREVARRAWALPPDAREQWATLLADWADWLLLADLIGRDPSTQSRDSRSAWQWATACFQTGRLDEAAGACLRRLLTEPDCPWALDLYAACGRWRGFLDRTPAIVDDAFRLEPLGHQHCGDFAWQYWDPDIARRCCLPDFRDAAHWHRWLDECWSYGDQRLYAVLHPAWGFVGCVSLTMHDATGFFYYWIGRDFQGNGFGPAAVRVLLEDAHAHRGMTSCYAKVFEDNAASRAALARIGFAPLDFKPAPPHHDELFYRIGPPLPRERCVEQLRLLFHRMCSETRIAVPVRPAGMADD